MEDSVLPQQMQKAVDSWKFHNSSFEYGFMINIRGNSLFWKILMLTHCLLLKNWDMVQPKLIFGGTVYVRVWWILF